MTAFHRPGQAITLQVAPADHYATGATDLSFVVKDAAGGEVQSSQPAVLNGDVFEVAIGITANATDMLIDTRIVELSFTLPAPASPVESTIVYDLVSLRQLRVPSESVQTYEEADAYARVNMADLVGWAGATKEQRISAMLETTRMLRNLPWRRCGVTEITSEHILTCKVCSNPFLMSQQQLRQHDMWPSLRAAQLKQCNYLLGGKPLDDLRAAGLMSNTVGESSQMYRMQVPLDLGLGKDALKEIGRWVSYNVRLGRA